MRAVLSESNFSTRSSRALFEGGADDLFLKIERWDIVQRKKRVGSETLEYNKALCCGAAEYLLRTEFT